MSDETTPELTAEAPEASGPGVRKLYPKDWLEIITLAKEGQPVAKIAKAFKVRKSTIYRGLKKRKIRLGAYVAAAEEVVENEATRILIERIRNTKDRDYQFTEVIQRQIMKLLTEASASSTPFAQIADNLKALNIAMRTIRSGTENKWRILGLDRDNEDADRELPELPLRELTDEEIEAMRDRQILEDDLTDDELTALDGGEDIAEEGEDEEE